MFRIDNELKGANLSRSIRFPEALFEKLSRVAWHYDVSFNLLILQCCKYALEHMEPWE